jgi:hypothetical protein
MSRKGSNVITARLAADDEWMTGFETSGARTRIDVAHSACGWGKLSVFGYNGTAVPHTGFTPSVEAHISMSGTRGSTPVVILNIRGWKEAESRPRSWR